MEQSPRLALSYLQPQQAQKHVTVNEAFRRLDALVGLAVKSRTTHAQPSSPSEGDAYIMTASASGAAWSAYAENAIAVFQDGAWTTIAPAEGVRAFVTDEGALYAFTANAWSALNAGGGGTPAQFGVNAAPDATNRLAVKSDAVLHAHDDVTPGTGDARHIISKANGSAVASLLFQDNFSGRAEIGLVGDNNFRVKVSPDDFTSSFSAIEVDASSGYIGVLKTPASNYALDVGGGFRFDISDPAVNQDCFIRDFDTGGVTNVFWYDAVTRNFYLGTQAAGVVVRAGNLRPNTDNSISCGTSGARWSVVYAATGTINTSDERLKRNIADCDLGLEFVLDLRPIKYQWREGGQEIIGVNPKTDQPITRAMPGKRFHYGLSAQDVRSAADKAGVKDFAAWVLADKADPESVQGLRYDQFIAVLITAVQQLTARVAALEENRRS